MLWMFNPIILLLRVWLYRNCYGVGTEETACRESSISWPSGISQKRALVKRNNAEFTNVSTITLLLTCSTHFTMTYRILLSSLPTSNNFFQCVYSEIPIESAWRVLFKFPWCCLLLGQLQVIKTWFSCILDFWNPGTSYLVQEDLVPLFLFVFSVLYTKNALKSAQFSQYNTYFLTIWQ